MSKFHEDANMDALVERYPAWFPHADRFSYIMPGWVAIVTDLCAAIDQALGAERSASFRILQIKEKFGGLRFYARPVFEEVKPLVLAAEERAYRTCEICGQPGELRDKLAWWSTLCEDHFAEQRAREGRSP